MPQKSDPTMPRPIVVFDHVQKSYDGVTRVVESLNLEIAEGEFLTLLGPSGSGKTTTLMMLAGFEKPSAGQILFDGQPITDTPTWKRNFGMVFQNYALFPHMTVAQNLAFPLRMHKFGRSDIEGRVARALDMVQLGHAADRRPAQLSGGQQQRVALARALVFEPRMVLMDEPLGALDKQLREHMQLEIRALHDRLGLTMLYVTHDQSEALTMSDRIAIFNAGEIQHIGAPDEVYDHPRTAFVARFMGENNPVGGMLGEVAPGQAVLRTAAGTMLRGQRNVSLTTGTEAELLVRPERLRIDDARPQDNVVSGRVVDVIYHGDHLRIQTEVEPGLRMTARIARGDATGVPVIGQTVRVCWSPEDAHIFPAP